MDFKSMLEQLSQLSEATKETKTGRVHKAEPGGYGRKFDTDEEGEEKKEKKPEAPKKRGRPPATGAHSKEEQKKAKERDEAGKRLQSHIVGNLPKSHSKTKGTVVKGKAQSGEQKEGGDKKKKSVKEWIEEVEQQFIAESTPGQQLTVKPMPGAAQLVDPATQKVMATGDAAAVKNIQGAVAQGKVQMRGEEMTEGSEPVASGELLKFAQEKANHMGHQTYPVEYKGRIGRISGFRGDDTLTIEFADKPGYVFSGIPKNAVTRYQPVQPEKKSSMWESAEDYSAKKARAGKDIGKPGKAFGKIAKDAGEKYGSKERGEKVAGAVLAKLRKSHTSESVNESVLNEAFTVQGLKQVVFQLVNLRKQAKLAELGQGRAPNPTEVVNTLYDAIVAIEDVLIPMMERQAQAQAQVREGEIPHESGVDNIGAGLGAGRSQTTLEAKEDKKAMKKDHKAEKEGKKVTKDMEKVEEAAKPDYIDLDKDGDKKETMKKAADDKKKKKVNESMHKHSAARLMGKAHALAKEGYNCRYDDMDEAKMYHEGYKEGLDECYGQQPIVGLVKENPPATVPGMADQAEGLDEMGIEEMTKGDWMKHKAQTTPGDTFKAFGQTMKDSDVLDEFAFESWSKELDSLLTESSEVTEGMTVSISKGQQGAPDSVSVSAQDGEADALLGLIKQAGLGLFGDDTGQMPAGPDTLMQKQGGIDVVGDHDGMMALIKKVAGDEESSDYEDEEGHEHDHEEHGEEEHDHTNEETCNECGYMESKCGCEKEQVEEVESEDQMAYEVAEDNAPDSGAAETTADENAEAAEDNALAVAAQQNKTNTVNEWANQIGKGPGKGTDASFEQDIEFMTKFIAGGLNKPKSTGQTTIPVIAGQETRMEDPMAWAKLAGIKK